MPIDQFQGAFPLSIFETMQLHTNNPVNEFKSRTFVRTTSAYTNMLERVGYQHFFDANRRQSMSCDHFRVIIDWSSIGRCQSIPINYPRFVYTPQTLRPVESPSNLKIISIN